MNPETDRPSPRKGKQDSSLTEHLDATDFFPPGTGWNKASATAPEQKRQDAGSSPQSPLDQRGH